MWVVSKVYKQQGALLCNCMYGPSKTDVTAVPVTDAIVRSFGWWFSVLRATIMPLMLALVKEKFGAYLWMSLAQLTDAIRSHVQAVTPDDEMRFCSQMAEHMASKPAQQEFRDSVEADPDTLREVLSQRRPPNPTLGRPPRG